MLSMEAKIEAPQLGQLRRGVADRCVLALLEQRERYGFELAKMLSEARLIAGEGTIYPLLARLRREGLVDTVWRESTEGPPRRYYTLTDSGARALEGFRAEWLEFTRAVNRLLMPEQEDRHEAVQQPQ